MNKYTARYLASKPAIFPGSLFYFCREGMSLFKNIPYLLFALVLLFWFPSSEVNALEIEYLDIPTAVNLEDVPPQVIQEPPAWKFDFIDPKYEIELRRVYADKLSLCFEIGGYLREKDAQLSFVQGENLQKKRGRLHDKNRAGSCSTLNENTWTAFNVYVVSKGNGLRVRVKFDNSVKGFGLGKVKWQLLNESGDELGFYERGQPSGSRWGPDFKNSSRIALYLLDEKSSGRSVADQKPIVASDETVKPVRGGKKSRASTSRAKELTRVNLQKFSSNSPVFKKADDFASLIKWKRNESVNELYLQVMPSLSDASKSYYCVRPVYNVPNGFKLLTIEGDYWQTSQKILSYSDIQRELPSSCAPADHLTFLAFFNASGNALQGHDARLQITANVKDSVLDLKSANIKLVEFNRSSTQYAAISRQLAWGYDSQGRLVAVLEGAGKQAYGTKAEINLLTGQRDDILLYVDDESAERISFSPGEYRYTHRLTNGKSKLNLVLSASSQVKNPVFVTYCNGYGVECRESVVEFTSNNELFIAIDLVELGILDQPSITLNLTGTSSAAGSTGKSDSEAAKEKSVKPEIVTAVNNSQIKEASGSSVLSLSPTLYFGDYGRSLTGCVAELKNADGSPVSSSSLKRGVHVFDDLPIEALNNSESWSMAFTKTRKGQKCPAGITEDVLLSSVLSATDNEENAKPVKLTSAETLFVGYLHLSKADYRESFLRWSETLEFFNRVYEEGRNRYETWIDGVVFGPGEERETVDAIVEPKSNFVKTLDGGDGLENITEDLFDRAQSVSKIAPFRFDQYFALEERLGSAKIHLLYFDDAATAGTCDEYAAELEGSGLVYDRVVVIAAADDYGGTNFPRDKKSEKLSGNLVDVCGVGEEFRVYWFDSNEVHAGKVWDNALSTIAENYFEKLQ